jgi:hypothetical protein
MHGLEKLIAGILLGLAALAGLYVGANAHDGPFSFFGMLLFLFAVMMLFRFIALVTGKAETKS